jgi:hypothetical protein
MRDPYVISINIQLAFPALLNVKNRIALRPQRGCWTVAHDSSKKTLTDTFECSFPPDLALEHNSTEIASKPA